MENAQNIQVALGKKLRHLREQAGMSQTKLASLAGMVQPMINRFETGERRITVEHATKLAPALSIAPADLLPPKFADIVVQASPIGRAAPTAATMPVLGVDGAAIDETPVPPVLATASHRYAMYMVDTSMAPRYAAGVLLHVNPHKPAAVGRGIVVVLKDGRRLVRELVYSEPTHLQVKHYGIEPGTENYPQDSVTAVHTIVGTVEA